MEPQLPLNKVAGTAMKYAWSCASALSYSLLYVRARRRVALMVETWGCCGVVYPVVFFGVNVGCAPAGVLGAVYRFFLCGWSVGCEYACVCCIHILYELEVKRVCWFDPAFFGGVGDCKSLRRTCFADVFVVRTGDL